MAAVALIVAGLDAPPLADAAMAGPRVTISPSFTIVDINGTKGSDRIAIACKDDRLLVNGERALGGRARCMDLDKVRISTFAGDDTVTIPRLSPKDAPFFQRVRAELEVSTGPGNDNLRYEQRLSRPQLGPGDDEVRAGAPGLVSGDAGDDDMLATSSEGVPYLSGGRGTDTLRAGPKPAVLLGGPGPDTSRGGSTLTVHIAGPGDDVVIGGRRADVVASGSGDDVVRGGPGNDVVAGQRGRDDIAGGPQRDALFGGSGQDQLTGGPGADLEFQDGKLRRLKGFPTLVLLFIIRDPTRFL